MQAEPLNANRPSKRQAAVSAIPGRPAKRQAPVRVSPNKAPKRQAPVRASPNKAPKRQAPAKGSPSSRPVNAPQQQQQERQEQEAPLSFRKRPRKPPRPQCSGPSVFVQPPSPDATKDRPNSQGSPSGSRQLRPRHSLAGRWAAKGSRRQSDCSQGLEGASSQQSPPPRSNATRLQHSSSNVARPQSEPPAEAGTESVAVAAALPDNMLFVDGVMTTWTDVADRAIMLACLIQAQGHPSLEVFDGLVSEICASGPTVTLPQVQARFRWLLARFLANHNQ